MDHFEHFSVNKIQLVESLNQLRNILLKLDNIGIDISDDIKKVESAVSDIQNDILRIALFGAFSDGKTSVIAGWLGQVMSNMKIDINESSDELAIYHPDNLPDKCEVVDTPGLFGDKEIANDTKGEFKYEDITKKYISEAHLIFYVVDPINPLKDSHKNLVKWVLRDLNKLSSTIFIINKMDEIADLTDGEDFDNQAKIKKENLLGKLSRYVGLTEEEKKQINIVCLSANPNNRGLVYWFDKMEMYEKRSRIDDLKRQASLILDNTTKQQLIQKTGMDVVREIVNSKIAAAEIEFVAMDLYKNRLLFDINRISSDIANVKKEILASKNDFLNELLEMDKQLLGKLRRLSIDTVQAFLEDEIGYSEEESGYKLRLTIEVAAENKFQHSAKSMSDIAYQIDKQIKSTESFIDSFSSAGIKSSGILLSSVSKIPVCKMKEVIFMSRDTLGKFTGVVYKFKPWGVVTLANNIVKCSALLSLGVDMLSDYIESKQKQEEEKELKRMQYDIAACLKDIFKDYYDFLRDDTRVFNNFAPQLFDFERIQSNLQDALEDLINRELQLANIKKEFVDTIDAEFQTCPR